MIWDTHIPEFATTFMDGVQVSQELWIEDLIWGYRIAALHHLLIFEFPEWMP